MLARSIRINPDAPFVIEKCDVARKAEAEMNRKQARAIMKTRTRTADLNDPRQAQKMLEDLPVATLIAGINNSLAILQKRGIRVTDWDDKERELYRLKAFGNKTCFLAARPDGTDSRDS